ncbi:TlpA family protein disulfide reductase [Rubrivirga sp.]|uniref:TlpA family protein disulfide reductase n=1 Tax=Rubrivirga sp. TaxID=1885344 RepID=UPI003C7911E9
MLRSIVLAPLALAFFLAAPAPTETTTPPDADVYAVVFYADWCGNCRILDPKVMTVWPGFSERPIEMVKLDFTDAETTACSEALAARRGLEDVYAANAGRTGFVVLVDASSGEEVGRIGARDTVAEIRTKLNSALAQS